MQEKEVPQKTLFLRNATCYAHALLPKTLVITHPELTPTISAREHGHKWIFYLNETPLVLLNH